MAPTCINHRSTNMVAHPHGDGFWCPKCGGTAIYRNGFSRNGSKPAEPHHWTVIDLDNAAHYRRLAADSKDRVNIERFTERAEFYERRAAEREALLDGPMMVWF